MVSIKSIPFNLLVLGLLVAGVLVLLISCLAGAQIERPEARAEAVPAAVSRPPSTDEAALPAPEPTPAIRPTHTARLEQLEGYIPNPYMGWQDTQYEDKRFVETVGYRRVNWQALNPAENVYDWDEIETLRRNMVPLGGTISFRVRTAQPPPWGEGQVMPDWLVEQGAMIVEGDTDLENVRGTEPLYAGCLFLEAHARFIEAMRQRYDGDPDVAFIDIGTYGTYGEWDSEQYDDEENSLDWHARRRIIDMYLGGQGVRPCLETDGNVSQVSYNYPGFQKTQLVMPYTPLFADSLVYALSRREDVGIRHDALGSEKHQARYREEIGTLVEQRWRQAPIVFEFYPTAYTPRALASALEFAREMHASFVHDNFDGWGNDKQIEELLAGIGYRLVLHEMSYTSELEAGETLQFKMAWENMGIAPPYFNTYPLVISLTDVQGLTQVEQQFEVDIRRWLPGQPVQLQGTLPLPADLPAGIYDLRVAFVDPETQKAVLHLAIAGEDKQGHYLIGAIRVLP